MSRLHAVLAFLRRKPVAIAISFTVTAVALWLALRSVDFDRAWASLLGIRPWGIFVSLAAMVLGTAIRSWRWHLFMRRSGSSMAASLESILVSIFFTGLLPLRTGEAMRVAYFSRRTGAPVLATASGLVLERVLDVVTIMALGGYGVSVMVGDRFPGLPFPPKVMGLAAVGACLATVAAGYILARRRAARPHDLGPDASALRRRFSEALDGLSSLESAAGAVGVIGLSFAMWILTAVPSVAVFAAAGHPVPFQAGYVILVALAFAVALPASPGFVGTYHLGFIGGATLMGYPADVAAAVAIVTHLMSQVPFIIAGGVVLATGGRRVLGGAKPGDIAVETVEAVESNS